MDLLKQLERADQNRARLQVYILRVQKARWLFPGTVREIVREYENRFEDATRGRRRILELIHANPLERERYRAREKVMLDKAAEMLVPRKPLPPGTYKPYRASDATYAVGKRVSALGANEALWETHLKEAQHYYITGAWQQHGIAVGKVTELMDDITLQRDIARMTRGRLLDGLFQRVGMELQPGQGSVSLQVDQLLTGISKNEPQGETERSPETPLTTFLAKELGGNEPLSDRRKKVKEPQR